MAFVKYLQWYNLKNFRTIRQHQHNFHKFNFTFLPLVFLISLPHRIETITLFIDSKVECPAVAGSFTFAAFTGAGAPIDPTIHYCVTTHDYDLNQLHAVYQMIAHSLPLPLACNNAIYTLFERCTIKLFEIGKLLTFLRNYFYDRFKHS